MARPDKRIPALFYRSESGKEPVRDWLKSGELSAEERRRIGEDVKTVEYGWPVGMPTCRAMGQGLWEVRTHLKGRIARVLFCIHAERLVLLHGFIKKTQRTPEDDLALALDRKRRLETEP